ncbi:transglutaminase-like domain-containing protein [Streptomyces sp. NBC_01754]|uniref:transglutaminase-like domain-containing protein n=1 Tax=Streptomyces sp. NBC_01754 TaxID=2975930 RepID=UPI002DDC288C|nr:transglutaminase-like domain-containing protein [Streptomyces sp. NBC_01754]WSC94661.1 transglutaminase-like domain-containing protein [Streptomyces sp. NBC_01754]
MSAQDPRSGTAGHRRRFADEARAERPDLALLCLLVGAEAGPPDPASPADPYGIDAAQIELDRLAGLLPYGARPARAWAAALQELLGGRCGFAGGATDYQRLESSLLQRVLRTRRGLPILLSVVWTEVARRAGAPVYGVALPGHYVVGFGDPAEQVLADPFAGGVPLSGEDAALMVAGTSGARPEASTPVPAGPLETVLRILNNVRAWATARPERTDVALWALELSLLLPSHPARLRYERAQLLVRRGEFLRGAAEMEEYAEVVERVEPAAAAEIRRHAQAARAMLN